MDKNKIHHDKMKEIKEARAAGDHKKAAKLFKQLSKEVIRERKVKK